jgi:rod shape-determining protein MreC
MLAFLRKNQILLSSGFCLLFSLYILTAAARGRLKEDPVGPILLWLMRPVQIAADTTSDWIKDGQEIFSTVAGFRAENQRLKKRIQELEIERNKLLEAGATNRRLQELLDFRSSLPAGSVTASIIGNSASSWFQTCLLNKGTADGLRKGMAVVTPLGIIGQAISASAHTTKVLLITDSNSGVDALVQRTRTRGIVSGSLENGMIMKYVKRSEGIQEGDRLITSGSDGVFPKGLMIGWVSKVRKQSLGLFQYVEVTPAVASSRTENVLVLSVDPNANSN